MANIRLIPKNTRHGAVFTDVRSCPKEVFL